MWRVFEVDGLACPTCGEVMGLRAEVRPPATLAVRGCWRGRRGAALGCAERVEGLKRDGTGGRRGRALGGLRVVGWPVVLVGCGLG
ncbi:MAG: hypothetical protein EA397_17935 [Deltaproteobacteria bacterium]|nr:MAG: hypothetical protein EA397_17935 [Deltaproteobacteria bacterium]